MRQAELYSFFAIIALLFACFPSSVVSLSSFLTTPELQRSPVLKSLNIPPCDTGNAVIPSYYLTNAPAGQYISPKQNAQAEICYNPNRGFSFTLHISDSHLINPPFSSCNTEVWKYGSVFETFISRVASPYDVPREYYEIDLTPNGVVYGALVQPKNVFANVTTCPNCVVGQLPCSDSNTFPTLGNLDIQISNVANGVTVHIEVPFSAFDSFIGATTDENDLQDNSHNAPLSMAREQNVAIGTNKWFKFGLFRYDYPDGINGEYELSGAQPTFSPSFHVPEQFILATLIP